MAWLVRDGDVLAALDVVDVGLARRAVAGVKDLESALLLRPAPLVLQTFTAGTAVDVAFCDRDMVVRRAVCVGRRGLTLPRPGSACAVVARGGAFERWTLLAGDRLEVKGG
jgi:hypothetical protein